MSNNTGPGIYLEVGAGAGLGYPAEALGAVVTGNAKEGVLVTRGSNLWIASQSAVSDNKKSNITCDDSAWLFGDLTGISSISCKNVLPDAGGKK